MTTYIVEWSERGEYRREELDTYATAVEMVKRLRRRSACSVVSMVRRSPTGDTPVRTLDM